MYDEILLELLPHLSVVLNDNDNESENFKYLNFFVNWSIVVYNSSGNPHLLFMMTDIIVFDIPSKYSAGLKRELVKLLVKDELVCQYMSYFLDNNTENESNGILSSIMSFMELVKECDSGFEFI